MILRWLAALLLAGPASAGLLSPQGVSVTDATGAPRATFSTNETIGFTVAVFNGAASPNRTSFEFDVYAPNGNDVFRHVGNSVRGTVGNAASTVSGVAISGFAQGPGTYRLKATATLDGVTVEQDQTFVISSPNLLLIYPPNGSQNLTDNPLTFQWYSSGAASYVLTVGNNPSLYNSVFSQTAPGGTTSLTYPQNPTDARQRLSTGQIYYWNVTALDVNGNVLAQSQVPFSFSVANTALTRDLAVTAINISGPADASGNIPFTVTVADQGNTTETNTPLRVTVGGLTAPNTPLTVATISPGDSKTFAVSAPIPTDMTQALAIACLTIFDDNVANNCMTLSVARPPALSSTTLESQTAPMSSAQVWQAIEQILQDQGVDLSAYNLVNMEGSLTQAELVQLLDQLRQGQASATLTGPPLLTSLLPPTAAPVASTAAPASAFAPVTPSSAPADAQSVAPEQTWSGLAAPLSTKTLAVAVTKPAVWRRLWSRLSLDPVPDVDFAQHIVLAIDVGGTDVADRVEIEDARASDGVLHVRYRLVSYARPFAAESARAAAQKKTTPYFLDVVPRTVLKVEFERQTEGSDE